VDNDLAHSFDVCLLLRAYCEQLWLTTEVAPVVGELEPPCSVPDEQLGAAFAYLEVVSIDAARRARETEAAYAAMVDAPEHAGGRSFGAEARRYHEAVRALRRSLAGRVARLTRTVSPAPASHQPAAL
jgi:hypothetical protein